MNKFCVDLQKELINWKNLIKRRSLMERSQIESQNMIYIER